MQSYTLRRDGDRNLAFTGQLLGEASSRRPGQDRWFEAQIFKTEAGTYIVAGVGRSDIEGETDRCWAVTASDGAGVVQALTRIDEDDIEYLTRTARDALNAATEHDEGIKAAFLKQVA